MKDLRAAAVVVLVAACGGQPVVVVDVTYQLERDEPQGCIALRFTPEAPSQRKEETTLGLSGRPRTDTLRVAALPEPDWTGQVRVDAELQTPTCGGPPAVTASGMVTPRRGAPALALRLEVPHADGGMPDGGSGGGAGGSGGAGGAGGGSAGGGSAGGGSAGGGAAGGGAAGGGSAGGGSAGGGAAGGGAAGGGAAGGGAAGGGAAGCDGGFRAVGVANVTGGTIFEAVGYGNPGAVWLGGHSNSSEVRVWSDAGFVERAGPPCGGRIFAGWARDDGVFYVAGDGFGLKGLVPGAADCNALAPSGFTAYGIDGIKLNASTVLLALVGREFQGPQPKGARAQLIQSTFLAGPPKEVTADVSALADELWDVAVQPGASRRFFAVGLRSGQEVVLSSLPDAGWQNASGFNSRAGVLSAVAFHSATEGYAAGSATLYRFDGTNWNAQPGALPFEIFGLAVVGPSDVYAVGAGEGIARWTGSWKVLRAPSGSAYLNRIRGPSACELFTSGSGSTFTSRP